MRKIGEIMGNLTFLEPDTFKQVLAFSLFSKRNSILICLYKLSASYLFFKT